jgi:hypothetical protein
VRTARLQADVAELLSVQPKRCAHQSTPASRPPAAWLRARGLRGVPTGESGLNRRQDRRAGGHEGCVAGIRPQKRHRPFASSLVGGREASAVLRCRLGVRTSTPLPGALVADQTDVRYGTDHTPHPGDTKRAEASPLVDEPPRSLCLSPSTAACKRRPHERAIKQRDRAQKDDNAHRKELDECIAAARMKHRTDHRASS